MALVVILIILAAIMLVPTGVHASYTGGSFTASVHVWFYKIGLYPPKEKKPSGEESEPTEAGAEPKPEKNLLSDFTFDDWLSLIKTALRALRHFKKVVFFDIIRLRAVISAPDPYDAVMRYNTVNGLVGSIIPFFESGFRVKERDIYIDLDMQSGESRAEAELSVSVRLGAALAVGLAAGFSFLRILINNRIRRIRERVARNGNGEQQTERNDADNNGQHQESC